MCDQNECLPNKPSNSKVNRWPEFFANEGYRVGCDILLIFFGFFPAVLARTRIKAINLVSKSIQPLVFFPVDWYSFLDSLVFPSYIWQQKLKDDPLTAMMKQTYLVLIIYLSLLSEKYEDNRFPGARECITTSTRLVN